MRIETATSPLWALATQKQAAVQQKSAAFAAATDTANLTAGRTSSSPGAVNPIDFQQATRQELFDWMNEEIRSGRMSLQESTPFLAMTVRVDAASGEQVDMASDATRFDFMERARGGIEFALSRFDDEGAERLRQALSTMQRLNVPATGLDVLA